MSDTFIIEGSCVQIRPARPDDLVAIAGLLGDLFRIERDFTPDPDRQLKGLRMISRLPERVLILVAVREEQVIGTCAIHDGISTAEGAQVAVLEDLVVAEPFRRRGIGSALLAAAETYAWRRGAHRLQLLADHTNHTALAFYARHGWESTQLVALRRRHPLPTRNHPPAVESVGATGL